MAVIELTPCLVLAAVHERRLSPSTIAPSTGDIGEEPQHDNRLRPHCNSSVIAVTLYVLLQRRLLAEHGIRVDRRRPSTTACSAPRRKIAKCRCGASSRRVAGAADVADAACPRRTGCPSCRPVRVAIEVRVVVRRTSRSGRTGRSSAPRPCCVNSLAIVPSSTARTGVPRGAMMSIASCAPAAARARRRTCRAGRRRRRRRPASRGARRRQHVDRRSPRGTVVAAVDGRSRAARPFAVRIA